MPSSARTWSAGTPPLVRRGLGPAAVGYIDNDFDLPLPDPDFVDRIEMLLGLAPTPRQPATVMLPKRKPAPVNAAAAARPAE